MLVSHWGARPTLTPLSKLLAPEPIAQPTPLRNDSDRNASGRYRCLQGGASRERGYKGQMAPRPDRPDRGAAVDDAATASGQPPPPVPLAVIGSRCVRVYVRMSATCMYVIEGSKNAWSYHRRIRPNDTYIYTYVHTQHPPPRGHHHAREVLRDHRLQDAGTLHLDTHPGSGALNARPRSVFSLPWGGPTYLTPSLIRSTAAHHSHPPKTDADRHPGDRALRPLGRG